MYDRIVVFELNVEHLRRHPYLPKEKFDETVSYLLNRVLNLEIRAGAIPFSLRRSHHDSFIAFLGVLAQRGHYANALQLLKKFIQSGMQFLNVAKRPGKLDAQMIASRLRGLQSALHGMMARVFLIKDKEGMYLTHALDFVTRIASVLIRFNYLVEYKRIELILMPIV